MSEKAALVILDGWGIGRHDRSDAIWNAKTPFTDMLWDTFPHASLRTDGEHVGLPEGQMGNSEVGHMNIGAGRIVWQMLVRINFEQEIIQILACFFDDTVQRVTVLGIFYQMTE